MSIHSRRRSSRSAGDSRALVRRPDAAAGGDHGGVIGRIGARLLLHADLIVRLGEVIWVACLATMEAQVGIVEDACDGGLL